MSADAMHASAPQGCGCADCSIDGEPCPTCYAAWWGKRHPNVTQHGGEARVEPSAQLSDIEAELRKLPDLNEDDIDALVAMCKAGIEYAPELRRRKALRGMVPVCKYTGKACVYDAGACTCMLPGFVGDAPTEWVGPVERSLSGARSGEKAPAVGVGSPVSTAMEGALSAQPVASPSAQGPDELWLQLHGDCLDSELSEPVDYTSDDVTWCWHQIHGSDVRYVRADIAASRLDGPNAALPSIPGEKP